MAMVYHRLFLCLLIVSLFSCAFGADDFSSFIQAGDAARQQNAYQLALQNYRNAFKQASSPTDQGIAAGKQAEVYADDLSDFDSARERAEAALKLKDSAPVSTVIALRVLAKCQMRDQQWPGAIKTLETARRLHDVDWMQPTLTLMLGDCYRLSHDFQASLKAYRELESHKQASRRDRAVAFLNQGLVYRYGLKQTQKATSMFAKATELDKGLVAEVTKHLPNSKPATRPLLLAHYMPWFTAKPFSPQWGWHWTMNHFRSDVQEQGRRAIASHYYPLIGPYDSGDPHVLEYHLLLMKLAGIDGVIVDWYGLTDFRDYAQLHRNTEALVRQLRRTGMQCVVCYEDQTIAALVKAKRLDASDRIKHAINEINWLVQNWMAIDEYVRIDKKPVLLSFGHAGLSEQEWVECFKQTDQPIAYFSQHVRRAPAVGGFDWPVPKEGLQQVDRFFQHSKAWQSSIPVVFPRFHDIYQQANVGESYGSIADKNGQTMRETMRRSLALKSRIVQIATWNDWGEGTQVEPSEEFGYRDLELIQLRRFQNKSNQTGPTPADLRMPGEILKLRRAGKVAPERIERVVTHIVSGDLPRARSALASMAQQPKDVN